jgi:hypothetical protein
MEYFEALLINSRLNNWKQGQNHLTESSKCLKIWMVHRSGGSRKGCGNNIRLSESGTRIPRCGYVGRTVELAQICFTVNIRFKINWSN